METEKISRRSLSLERTHFNEAIRYCTGSRRTTIPGEGWNTAPLGGLCSRR